ncbi:MAG: DNA polymerase I [Gammaproteobacteria bacterium]|nr:DNA polymerase I [Gammaproteobacteria bacterium]
MQNENPLILVDGSTYLFRAFYALPDLKTSTGQYTGAIRGVISMLLKMMNDYPGSTIAVVFDTAAKTFRHELYDEYKANRPPMQDEMAQQIEPLHTIIGCMGLPLLKKDGFEADDIIGTLATQATNSGRTTIISTSDKDMAQLVNEHVTMLDTMKNQAMNRDGVVEKFGVLPELIIDYLALMGDTSDNIPGVPKVGPKTAAKWLNQYGSLDSILEHKNEIKGKVGENLVAASEMLPMSRELATIKCDVELEWTHEELQVKEMDIPALTDWFNRLEFRTLLRQITEDREESPKAEQRAAYEFVSDPMTLKVWMDRIRSSKQISLVLQPSVHNGAVGCVGIALAANRDRAAYIPIEHSDSDFRQLSLQYVIDELKPLLEDDEISVIGSDLKSAIKFFSVHNVSLRGPLYDTRLMSYVLNSTAPGGHHTSALASRHLEHTTIDRNTLTGSGVSRIPLSQVAIPETAMYMAELACVNAQVYPIVEKELQTDPKMLSVYQEIEAPLTNVLAKMERDGVCIEPAQLQRLSEELKDRIDKITRDAFESAGEQFGLGSPKQLATILYDKLNLPAPRKTRTGARSTSEDILRELINDHPLPQLILDYRSATKLKSTYSDQLGHWVSSATGRVHTTYDQANAATGRLSSGAPNLQNIPIRTADGRRIREAFIAPPGSLFMSADYSQIELRIMAHLSGDESLQRAFNDGLDIHRATAADVYGIEYDKVNEDMRRNAKTINFGLIYGMSAFGLARNLGIGRGEAAEFIETYFSHYPGVRTYMDQSKAHAHDFGYVETIYGRRIYLDEINSRNPPRRQGAERLAINAPVQGSAADIIKRATVSVNDFLESSGVNAKMVLHVHDEIVFEVDNYALDSLREGVVRAMQNAAELSVNLEVDVGVGSNWSEAH